MINDRVFKPFLDEMLETLKNIDDPQLKGMRLSEMQTHGQRVKCTVSPYHTPALNGGGGEHPRYVRLSQRDVEPRRLESFYQSILCYSHYSQQALAHFGNAKWSATRASTHGITARSIARCRKTYQSDYRKPTVLYVTFGALSSLPHWAEKLGRLSGDVNLICKLHHGTCSRPEEAASLATVRRHLKQRTDSARPRWRCWQKPITC